MPFKSLMSVVTGDHDQPVLETATDLAQAWDAHLDIVALAVNRINAGLNYTELSATLLETGLHEARVHASALSEALDARLKTALAARYAVHPLVVPAGGIVSTLAREMRFADLAVLPRPYGPDSPGECIDVTECALFNAEVPTLVLPTGQSGWTPPRRIMLGWNEGQEALRAARAALPILTAADTVFITVIDPPTHGASRSDPGGLLSQMLARHGVRCEVDVIAKSLPRVGDVMLRHLQDRDADMLVMGAYGRSRWAEAMFGGATRQMLEDCPVPILMAR